MMKVTPTPLNDLILIEPKIMTDDRGFFIEIYRQDELLNAGITTALRGPASSEGFTSNGTNHWQN